LYRVSPDFVATTALAVLAGIGVENTAAKSAANTAVDLPFNVTVAVHGACFGEALRAQLEVIKDLQNERLRQAAGLSRERVRQLHKAPIHRLPEYAIPAGPWDPRRAEEARQYAIVVVQQPLFWIEAPGGRELRAGFASSFDRTLLVTDCSSDIVPRLVAAKPSRDDRRLARLLARLSHGGHIDVPALKTKGLCPIVQPRFGLVCATDATSLRKAILSDRPEVRALVETSILLAPADSAELPPHLGNVMAAGGYWKQAIENLLYARRSRNWSALAPFPCFHEPLLAWSARWQTLLASTPEHLRRHLTPFSRLPHKIASLFLQIGEYANWSEQTGAATAAVEIAEWLATQSLLCAADAHRDDAETSLVEAKEHMLAKIRATGPIDFWRLCRTFDQQDKARHQPVLEALLAEGRVHTARKEN